jgi:hypothetical protein
VAPDRRKQTHGCSTRLVRAGSGWGEFGFQQFFGEWFAGLFVLVDCVGLVTVFDGVSEDAG